MFIEFIFACKDTTLFNLTYTHLHLKMATLHWLLSEYVTQVKNLTKSTFLKNLKIHYKKTRISYWQGCFLLDNR